MTRRKQKRIVSDIGGWIFERDFPHLIGRRYRKQFGLSELLLQFPGSLSKGSRASTVPGLSLPGLPTNSFFQLLQVLLWNLIHVVMQRRDNAGSKGCEQPVN